MSARAILALAALLLAAGCSDSIDCCVDGGASAVVRGHLLDVTYAPLADATVQADGARRRCDASEEQVGSAEGTATADSVGAFTLPIFSFLGGPGRSCVRLVITPLAAAADTTAPIEVEFFSGHVTDTTEVLLRIPGA